MFENSYWGLFAQSGNIDAYMAYRSARALAESAKDGAAVEPVADGRPPHSRNMAR